jgi:hypothetical protein
MSFEWAQQWDVPIYTHHAFTIGYTFFPSNKIQILCQYIQAMPPIHGLEIKIWSYLVP